MINRLESGPGIAVSGYIGTPWPYISINQVNPMQGMLRINGQELQAFDNNTWINIPSNTAAVSLDNDTRDLLQWARTQRQLDMNRATLIANNPALENAYKAVLRAEANFDILAKFVEEDEPGIVVGYNFNTP